MENRKTNTISRNKKGGKATSKPKPNVPYHRKPDDMALEKWQFELRKQFAEKQKIEVKNVEGGIVFSDYQVYNPISKNMYKVAIRCADAGLNFCSCMDFKTNELGSCKHVEFVLFQINNNSRKKKILKEEYQPHYTSVFLQYGNEQKVRIRFGSELQNEFKKLAESYFDKDGILKPNGFSVIDSFLQQAYSLHPDFRCYTDAMDFILEKRENQKRNDAAVVENGLKLLTQLFGATGK